MCFDVLIIGSGLGGLSVALSLPPHLKIGLICKQGLNQCASDKAQGGIAAVLSRDDSLAAHVEDTLIAGAGLCDAAVVETIIHTGPAAIAWLQQQQVPFTHNADASELHLTREGGHSQRRVVHAADQTGHVVTETLQQTLRLRPNVHIFEQHMVQQLLVDASGCHGIKAFNSSNGRPLTLKAKRVVLATGGLGQLFALTTNPSVASADGLALAWRAGCRMGNLEFIQFHPTALALAKQPTFLISEALRGEGALLLRPDGHRFMPDYDGRAELAPRDIVARAIVNEMQQHQLEAVHLDISHLAPEFIRHHFPTISQQCLRYGIDITTMPIPIAPAAHYACGGVVTDVDGRTNVANLYAVGEVAYTGLHGANRLASNSLLECVVIGQRIAHNITTATPWPHQPMPTAPTPSFEEPPSRPEGAFSEPFSVQKLQALMSQYMGVSRSTMGMHSLYRQIRTWRALDLDLRLDQASLEASNMLLAAHLLVLSAMSRRESRGGHYHLDYPQAHPDTSPTILIPEAVMLE